MVPVAGPVCTVTKSTDHVLPESVLEHSINNKVPAYRMYKHIPFTINLMQLSLYSHLLLANFHQVCGLFKALGKGRPVTDRLVCNSLSMEQIFGCKIISIRNNQPPQPYNAHSSSAKRDPSSSALILCHHLSLDSNDKIISAKREAAIASKEATSHYLHLKGTGIALHSKITHKLKTEHDICIKMYGHERKTTIILIIYLLIGR